MYRYLVWKLNNIGKFKIFFEILLILRQESFFAEPLIWFTSKFALSAHSVWLAIQWPNVMNEWQRVEQSLPANPVQK